MSGYPPTPGLKQVAKQVIRALDAADRRRVMMMDAATREALEQLKRRLDYRLNDALCEMKPEHDDSITGFNEAWDIMRALFAEVLRPDRVKDPLPEVDDDCGQS